MPPATPTTGSQPARQAPTGGALIRRRGTGPIGVVAAYFVHIVLPVASPFKGEERRR